MEKNPGDSGNKDLSLLSELEVSRFIVYFPIGKFRSHLCFYLRPLPCSSVSWLATLGFKSHFTE